MLKSGLGFSSVRMHDVAMSKTMRGVIAYDGMPCAGDVGFVLHSEFDNLLFLENVMMPVEILTIRCEINDVGCFTHPTISSCQL